MNAIELKTILDDHALWLNGNGGKKADIRSADLRSADLRRADLSGADLRSADLDFSSGIPLWCGGSKMKLDDRQVMQLLAHICSCDVPEQSRRELDKVLEFAKQSHVAKHVLS